MGFNLKSKTNSELIELFNNLDSHCQKQHDKIKELEAEIIRLQKAEYNSDYAKCPDCKGKGYYLGYGNVKEHCDKCNGKKHFA